MAYNQYLADLSVGKRAIVNELVPIRIMNRKWDRISGLIDEHEEHRFRQLIDSLSHSRGTPDLIVAGQVCEICLSLSLGAYPRQANGNPLEFHKCDLKWSIDITSILKDKVPTIKYLEDKLGIYLLKLLQFLIPQFTCSLIVLPELGLETIKREKSNSELYRYSQKPDSINLTISETIIEACERVEKAHLDLLETSAPKSLSAEKLALLNNLVQLQNGFISNAAAVEVLSMLKRNSGLYKVHFSTGDRYFWVILF